MRDARSRAERDRGARRREVAWPRHARRPDDCRRATPRLCGVLHRARAPARPVGERHPGRQHVAVHGRGHGAVQAVLHRRGNAPVQARGVGAEVRARGRQAQRPRRHRPYQPALLVLRDARQLQLRRLLQRRRDHVGVGVLHRGAAARRRPAVGHGPRRRRRGRSASGATRSASPPTASSASATTTSGAWATPARAARRRRSSGISAREFGPDGGPITEADRYIEIWNLVFMQFDQQRRRHPRAAAEAEHRHRRRARTQRSWWCRARTSIWDIDVFRPLLAEARARDRNQRYGRGRTQRHLAADHRRARPHDDVHGERRCAAVEPGARLRAPPHHPARGASCLPARRARRS